MRISIRSKLILAISTLIIVIFAIASYLLINEKEREVADDIYSNSLAFVRLTAPDIAEYYDLYLAQNSFVYFNREISGLFAQNDDISAITVVSYDGELLYDSIEDSEKRYEGEPRTFENEKILSQVQSENISVITKGGGLYFIKNDAFVDVDENELESIKSGTLIEYFAVPANEKYTVIFTLDYHNLEDRVSAITKRIIYLALFAVMLGMILSFTMSSQITKPVAKLVKGALDISKGDFKSRVDIRTKDELSYLGGAFNKMAEDLEASLEAKLYKERVTHELELATEIQEQLIPKDIPQIEGLEIAAGITPASEIGGDIYDFILKENEMLFYLGDVTGHGVPAGIVSSIASALFYGFSDERDLEKILVNVNRVLKAKTMQTMFMTLCLMHWDVRAQKFSYSSAGHEQIIHFKTSTGEVEVEPSGGIALGMMEDISNHTNLREIALESGDFLVIYSDGLPEAWRSKHENYGIEKLKNTISGLGAAMSAEEIKMAIMADLKKYTGDYEQMDDMTIIVVKKT